MLKKLLAIKGNRIIDIGSGDGNLVRYAAKQGAIVTGLECGEAQLKKARSFPTVGDEVYVEGFAEDLPFEDASFDASIFVNSLHHVRVTAMSTALAEASRVTKPGGYIYVAEPIAAGSGFELCAPLDDETIVRAAAFESVQSAIASGLTQVCEVFYDTVFHYQTFENFKEDMIRVDPSRLVPFKAMEAGLRNVFDRIGVVDKNGVRFDQQMRVNMLENSI